jgi:hypothetical protein
MAQIETMQQSSSGRPASMMLPSQGGCGFNMPTRLALDTTAVNQNGSFEFDRVVKSGYLQKRTQRTKVRERAQQLRWLADHLSRTVC